MLHGERCAFEHIFFHPDFALERSTSLSVPELHRVSRAEARVADCTADRDFHPALKTFLIQLFSLPAIIHGPAKKASPKF